jgi:O-succinylhomoserine sulfhydrylase
MRASFAEEKDRNIAVTANPNTNEFVEKVCKMEGATAGFALLEWLRYIQRWLLY